MSLAKSHRTMPTTVWIYPTCCHTFGKSPTNAKDFQKIPTNSKRFHYNLENSNFPGGQSLLGDFSYFYNTWQTGCLLFFSVGLEKEVTVGFLQKYPIILLQIFSNAKEHINSKAQTQSFLLSLVAFLQNVEFIA